MPLIWRVLLSNALVVTVAAVALAAAPVEIDSSVAASDALILAAGVLVIVGADFLLLRQAFRPLHQLIAAMRGVDLLRPGARLAIAAPDRDVLAVSDAFNEMVGRLESERRTSARRAIAAQEAERLRVSRELHDEIGQRLTGVLLQLSSVEGRVDPAIGAIIAGARDEVRLSMDEVREIAQQLRPPVLEQLGLSSALTALTVDVGHHAGLPIGHAIAPALPALPDELEVVVYRVAQESLTNVARHARASSASLALRVDGGELVLEVADDGVGFDAQRTPPHAGLAGMNERALLVGGRLTVDSSARSGTTVRLRAPLPPGRR